MKPKEFEAWLKIAKPGDRVVYWQGASCALEGQQRQPVAQLAYLAAAAGQVALLQRRVREGLYDYIAWRVSASAGRILRPSKEAA